MKRPSEFLAQLGSTLHGVTMNFRDTGLSWGSREQSVAGIRKAGGDSAAAPEARSQRDHVLKMLRDSNLQTRILLPDTQGRGSVARSLSQKAAG